MTSKQSRRRSPFAIPEVPLEPVDALSDIFTTTATPETEDTKPKRDRSWDARRSKATYDLPQDLIQRIRDIATELGDDEAKVKVSDVVRLLLEAGLEQYEHDQLRVQPRPTGFTLFDD